MRDVGAIYVAGRPLLENLEMSGNLKPVREMSENLLTVRELSGNKPYHGKGFQILVVASCIFPFIQVFNSIQLIQLILRNEVMLKFIF